MDLDALSILALLAEVVALIFGVALHAGAAVPTADVSLAHIVVTEAFLSIVDLRSALQVVCRTVRGVAANLRLLNSVERI